MQYMARSNTFGDQLTLFAAANLFNVNVHVISILGLGASHTFQPISSNAMGTVYLGHFAENHGEHYVSLAAWSQSNAGSTSDDLADCESVSEDIEDDLMTDNDQEDDTIVSQEIDINEQQFLNNDVLEMIIKFLLCSFPFMRSRLKDVNRFFRATVEQVPFPSVYILELANEPVIISVRRIINLKGRGSGAVVRVKQIINSPRWHLAWLKLRPQSYGWVAITDITWKI